MLEKDLYVVILLFFSDKISKCKFVMVSFKF